MRSAYNYTIVERHKQRIYIPYIGLEFSGWTMLLCMLGGALIGVLLLGVPLSFLLGDFAYVLALGIAAISETAIVTLITEIDRESGKNKMITLYYTYVKKYRMIYDEKGQPHYIPGKQEGVIFYVC